MALNGAALVADVATVGQGGGLAVRAANAGIRIAKAVDKANDVYETVNTVIETGKVVASGDTAEISRAVVTATVEHVVGGGKGKHEVDLNANGVSAKKLDGVDTKKVDAETDRRGDMQQADSMHQAVEAGTDYSNLPEPKGGAKDGADFTQKTHDGVWQVNKARNAGVNRTDSGAATVLDKSEKSVKGVTPSPSEGQLDHVKAKSKGGTNSPINAELLTREENRRKSNK